MCAHGLSCRKLGWVDALYQSINILVKCLKKVDTHTELRKYIIQYAKVRGRIIMVDVLHDTGRRNRRLAASQELIVWGRFMKVMMYKDMLVIQQDYLVLGGARGTPTTPTS